MKVRDYGYLDADNRIVYADDFAEIDGVIYTSPKAEHRARETGIRNAANSTRRLTTTPTQKTARGFRWIAPSPRRTDRTSSRRNTATSLKVESFADTRSGLSSHRLRKSYATRS